MKNKNQTSLKVALYGMDQRSYKMMSLYLKGPCKGLATVVNETEAEAEAEIDLLDADHIKARELLDQLQSKTPTRPIIILSLEEIRLEGTIYVKKPVKMNDIIAALKLAKESLGARSKKNKVTPIKVVSEALDPAPVKKTIEEVAERKQAATKHIDNEEKNKVSKHRTARDLTESNFSAYIGNIEGVDFSDSEQVLKASYNPKSYFLGYVQSALKACKANNRVLKLNSSWKPLIIFPNTHEVWLDAEDKQLRAFAGLAIKNNGAKSMSLSPIDQDVSSLNNKMEGFYDIDHFLWKLAVWTSKGRYPDNLDINKPVYLVQWPNFTRLVVTPHAMRIAALLIEEPRTAMNIAKVLSIKPQYVFVFISAANVLGLVGQARRQVDELIAAPEVKPSKTKGLLSRILSRLRG